MKRLSKLVAIGVLATVLLAGCVVVPLGGWGYGGGGYYRGEGRGEYPHYHAAPYRPYYPSGR
jgi:hypothetical protein